jgi:hypothetical protein
MNLFWNPAELILCISVLNVVSHCMKYPLFIPSFNLYPHNFAPITDLKISSSIPVLGNLSTHAALYILSKSHGGTSTPFCILWLGGGRGVDGCVTFQFHLVDLVCLLSARL